MERGHNNKQITIPEKTYYSLLKLKKKLDDNLKKGKPQNLDDLILGIDQPEKRKQLLASTIKQTPLETVNRNGEPHTISPKSNINPQEDIEKTEEKKILNEVLTLTLNKQELRLLDQRFGLNETILILTLDEIAALEKISREGIRCRLKNIFKKLKRNKRINGLCKDYFLLKKV